YLMKFQVRAGFRLDDGSDEKVNIFSGLASEQWVFDSEQRTVQITLTGLETLLINTKAIAIATTVTLENLGTGDASETEFLTDLPGVGEVTSVFIDGFKQVEGDDYEVSQLNDATLPAKITFTNPPDVGEVVTATYSYWPQDQSIKDLVELLLDAGGIPSGDQFV